MRIHWLIGAIAAVACSNSDGPAASPQDSSPPADTAPVDTGSDTAVTYDFSALETQLFGGAWKTDGVVVLHDGALVYEKYANGYDATKRHITYSASKTMGGALIGLAIADGAMKREDSICKYITKPADADPTLCDTTIEHLLHMSSGLKWLEEYETSPTDSSVLQMLYGNEADMGAYAARQPRTSPAGTVWSYSSGDANMLALALRGALAGKDVRAWAKEKLFAPAGITSAIFETDRTGSLVFSSSCFLTPRDFARFGQLFLDDGKIDGKQVLPPGWVAYSTTPAPPVEKPTPRVAGKAPGDSGGSYGALLWLNAASKDATPDTWAFPQVPVDAFSAEGHWGQKLFIVPSRKLVIARVGNDRDPVFDSGPMVQAAVAAIDAGGK